MKRTTPEYKVSKETANFLECWELLKDLDDKMYVAFAEAYGMKSVDEMKKANFDTHYHALSAMLKDFITSSIDARLEPDNLHEI